MKTQKHPLLFKLKVRKIHAETYQPFYETYQEELIPYDDIIAITTAQGNSAIKTAVVITDKATYQAQETFPHVFEEMQKQVGESMVIIDQKGNPRVCQTSGNTGFVCLGTKSKGLFSYTSIDTMTRATQTVTLKNGQTIQIDGKEEWGVLEKFYPLIKEIEAKKKRNATWPDMFNDILNWTTITTNLRTISVRNKFTLTEIIALQSKMNMLFGLMVVEGGIVIIFLIVILLILIFGNV